MAGTRRSCFLYCILMFFPVCVSWDFPAWLFSKAYIRLMCWIDLIFMLHPFRGYPWYAVTCFMISSCGLWEVIQWELCKSCSLCLRNNHRGGSFGCVRPSPRHEGLVTTKTDLQGDCSYSNTHTGLGEGSLGESSLGEPSLCELLSWWCRHFE